jgi:enoyl-CoA hydratase/carnithine racemase
MIESFVWLGSADRIQCSGHAAKAPEAMMKPNKSVADIAATPAPMVLRERLDAIAVLTLNRPDTRNSLSAALLAELTDALDSVAADASVRVVILAANGPVFSAGHDLKELTARRKDADGGRGFTAQLMERCSALMQKILKLPQPVIAAIEGAATAAGCQLVATCDLAVASKSARFSTPGVHIGLFCSTPMVALSRNVGPKHAMEMLLTGDMIPADTALRIGLINHVVEPGAAREEALKLARKIAGKPAATVKLGKQAFYRQLEMGLSDAYRYASEVMVENMMTHDAEEGIAAFIEKRDPRWDNG